MATLRFRLSFSKHHSNDASGVNGSKALQQKLKDAHVGAAKTTLLGQSGGSKTNKLRKNKNFEHSKSQAVVSLRLISIRIDLVFLENEV